MYRRADARRARDDPAAAVRGRATRRRCGTATATADRRRRPREDGERGGDRDRRHTHLRHRSRRRCACPSGRPRVEWQPRLVFPGLRRGRGALAPTRGRPTGRRSSARRQHDGRGPGGGADLARATPRRSHRRRGRAPTHARTSAERCTRAASRPTPRSAVRARARSSRSRSPARPAASCAGPRARARQPEPRAAEPCGRRSTLGVQEAARRRSPAASAGSPLSTRRAARSAGSPGSPSPRPQPPGSTFKIVTAPPALEEKLVTPTDRFPIETQAIIDGVELENANGESCGGSFANSFAHSCNSVFAPLGVEVGAEKLVETAERYGFNATPRCPARSPARCRRRTTSPPRSSWARPRSARAGCSRRRCCSRRCRRRSRPAASGATPTVVRRRPPGAVARDVAQGRAHDRGAHGRSRRLRHRHGGVARRRSAWRARPAPPSSRTRPTRRTRSSRRRARTPTPGSPPTRPVKNPEIAVAVLLVRNGAGGETAAPAARAVARWPALERWPS